MSPQIIFGTATFGMDRSEFQDGVSVSSVLELIQNAGVHRLDSGARYPPMNPGQAERLIGAASKGGVGLSVDTKVYTDSGTDGSGDLTAEAIERSITASLARLQRDSVNVLHIHRADPSTPIAEQVRAFNEQIVKGRCKAWGMSNVPVPMLKEIFRVCEEEGLRKPVCYQGDYNIITRGAEIELLPLLRKHNVAFNAYRSMAAGFMTGKFVKGNAEDTRFGEGHSLGKPFSKLYGDEALHTAFKEFDNEITSHNLTSLEVALRWIFYHSALKDADGIILGASKLSQIRESIAITQKGPLPVEVVQSADRLWAAVAENRNQIV